MIDGRCNDTRAKSPVHLDFSTCRKPETLMDAGGGAGTILGQGIHHNHNHPQGSRSPPLLTPLPHRYQNAPCPFVSCSTSTHPYEYLTWRSSCSIPFCYRFKSSGLCAKTSSYIPPPIAPQRTPPHNYASPVSTITDRTIDLHFVKLLRY